MIQSHKSKLPTAFSGFIAALCHLAAGSPAALADNGPEAFFYENFENAPLGGHPYTQIQGPWSAVFTGSNYTPGTWQVAEDVDDHFGRGEDNRILRYEHARHTTMHIENFENDGLITLSFEVYARSEIVPDETNRLAIRFNSPDDYSERFHQLELNPRPHQDRVWVTGGGSTAANMFPLDEVVRVDLVVNNTFNTVTYNDGHTLDPQLTSLWINGEQAVEGYELYQAWPSPGPIGEILFYTFSGHYFNGDLDNITLFHGAHVMAPLEGPVDDGSFTPVPVPPEDVLVSDDFETTPLEEQPLSIEEGGPWDVVSTGDAYTEGTWQVVEDEQDRFGRGSSNQVLRFDDASHTAMHASNLENDGVITLSFEAWITDDPRPDEADELQIQFWDSVDADTQERIHGFRLRPSLENQVVRIQGSGTSSAEALWRLGELVRVDLIINNSTEDISYLDDRFSLASGNAALWIDGQLGMAEYSTGRQLPALGTVAQVTINVFSSRTFTGDLDNVAVYRGAHVMAPFDEPGGAGGFGAWVAEHFDETEQADPAISGPEATPGEDGVPNLLRYVMGLGPWEPAIAYLPSSEIQSIAVDAQEEDYLTLTFPRRPDIEGVTLRVELSEDLSDWSQEAVWVDEGEDAEGSPVVTYRDIHPLNESERRFIRLRMVQE